MALRVPYTGFESKPGCIMISRREFHKGVVALALARLAAGPVQAGTQDDSLFYLNRLTFGATVQSRATFNTLGLEKWLARELEKPVENPDLSARLTAATLRMEYEAGETETGEKWPAVNEMRAYSYLDGNPEKLVDLLNYELPVSYTERSRPAYEVIAASFIRATHSDAQLREVMTGFWHEHFSVNSDKDEGTAAFFAQYDLIMRENAFGNFRTLLGAVAHAPSMLFYLNNEASRASPANENYARELLELHTLGAKNYFNDQYDDWKDVPKDAAGIALGYIDQDVYEVARAFTGWSVGDGRWIDEGRYAPASGKFYYVDFWHDPYQKRILGREFAPNRGPEADGEDVLDMLAAHPATARFISEKILRRLGIETPSQKYLDHVAQVFLAHTQSVDQIAHVLRAVILHTEFAQTPAQKLRRPYEFLIAMFRATGAEIVAPQDDLVWSLQVAGWRQHQVRPPTGHSDASSDWANTRALNAMVDFALYSHNDYFDGVAFDPVPKGAKTWADLAEHWRERFAAPSDTLDAFLSGSDLDIDEKLPTQDPEYISWGSSTAIGLAALSTQFMFR